MTDLAKLKELALAVDLPDWNEIWEYADHVTEQDKVDLDYVRAVSPEVVLELIERLERYEKALRFYVDKDNYAFRDVGGVLFNGEECLSSPFVLDDYGEVARQALADVG